MAQIGISFKLGLSNSPIIVANSSSVGAVSIDGYRLSPTVIKNWASSLLLGIALDLTVSIASKTMFGSDISLTQPKSPTTKKSAPFRSDSAMAA